MSSFDVAVIGSGPGGYVAAIRCAQLGMKTAIIEKYNTLGGTCLNVGCIPSKALLDSSHHFEHATKHFDAHGIEIEGAITPNLEKMIARKKAVVDQTCGGIDYLMSKNKIEVFKGLGSFKDATHINIASEDDEERIFETSYTNETGETITETGYDLETSELFWTNDKPIVVYGKPVVPSGETLIVDAGARIHFHEDSGLIVEPGASINFNGSTSIDQELLENEIIIESDRIAEDYDNLPGQWGYIWIMEGSVNNYITNTTIKNATTGILIEGNGTETSPSLSLENVQIYNSAAAGIQANATNIEANNVVINNSGLASLNIEQGGTYNFEYCTIVNYYSFGVRSLRAVNLSNQEQFNSDVSDTDLEANFVNCIITGSYDTEITLNDNASAEFTFNFENCLIDCNEILSTTNDNFDLTNNSLYTNCIFNENPVFENTSLNKLGIGETSAANGEAKITGITNDILGTERNSINPDIGAYESTTFEE